MHRKGVTYDVGIVMGMNWRPAFDPVIVRRELEIIRHDLHCTAVRIVGRSLRRLHYAAAVALSLGLEVWLSPQVWNRTAVRTARRTARAAVMAESLRQPWPDRLVFSVGSEFSLFARGILPGRSVPSRISNPDLVGWVRSGRHSEPLRAFLSEVVRAVKQEYHGKLTYASLVWEAVDWTAFDFVGVDHYRTTRIEPRYLELLRPALDHGKPVVITELGYDTMEDGPLSEGFLGSAGLHPSVIDVRAQFLHQLPVVGRWVRPRLLGTHERSEGYQARKLIEQLEILDGAGVDGTFVSQFLSQISPYDPDPRFDLDMASSSLVKYLERGKGTTYPDMPWEPKESFRALASFYATH